MNTMFSDSSPNEGRGLGFLLIKRVSGSYNDYRRSTAAHIGPIYRLINSNLSLDTQGTSILQKYSHPGT